MWYVTELQSSRFEVLQLLDLCNFIFDVHEEGQGNSATDSSGHDGLSIDQWRRSDL